MLQVRLRVVVAPLKKLNPGSLPNQQQTVTDSDAWLEDLEVVGAL